jgi:hypothetical protein
MARGVRHATLFLVAGLLTGCGPYVSESRMNAAPARPDDCELEFLHLQMMDMSPMGGTYEILGHVTVSNFSGTDPMSPENRALIRPRACAMGGEGVTIMLQATNRAGSTTNFTVVRKRPPPGAAPPLPTKF